MPDFNEMSIAAPGKERRGGIVGDENHLERPNRIERRIVCLVVARTVVGGTIDVDGHGINGYTVRLQIDDIV